MSIELPENSIVRFEAKRRAYIKTGIEFGVSLSETFAQAGGRPTDCFNMKTIDFLVELANNNIYLAYKDKENDQTI